MVLRLRNALLCLTLVVISGCGSTSNNTSSATSTAAARTGPTPAATDTAPTATAATTPARTPKSPKQAYSVAYDELPCRSGPLNVEQILLSDDDPSVLDVRVTPRAFFCSRPAAERLAAVRAYYADALAKVRQQGQDKLTIRVSRLIATGEIRDVYANAGSRAVTLTAKGAGAPPVAC